MLIYGAFRYFIAGPEGEFFAELFAGNGFPIASYINRLPFPGGFNILAVLFGHVEPSVFAFAAQVSLDDEKAVIFHENRHVVDGIVPGIQTDQERLVRELPAKGYCSLQEFHGSALAMLLSGAKLKIDGIPFLTDIGHHRRKSIEAFVGSGDPFLIGLGVVHGGDVNIQWHLARRQRRGLDAVCCEQINVL